MYAHTHTAPHHIPFAERGLTQIYTHTQAHFIYLGC